MNPCHIQYLALVEENGVHHTLHGRVQVSRIVDNKRELPPSSRETSLPFPVVAIHKISLTCGRRKRRKRRGEEGEKKGERRGEGVMN